MKPQSASIESKNKSLAGLTAALAGGATMSLAVMIVSASAWAQAVPRPGAGAGRECADCAGVSPVDTDVVGATLSQVMQRLPQPLPKPPESAPNRMDCEGEYIDSDILKRNAPTARARPATLRFALINDNAAMGVIPGGDDFGYTHGSLIEWNRTNVAGVRTRVVARTDLVTRDLRGDLARGWSDCLADPSMSWLECQERFGYERGADARIPQTFSEISSLEVERDTRAQGRGTFTRAGAAIGILNEGREIPGLALWQQRKWHEGLGIYTFDSRARGSVRPFARALVAQGLAREIGVFRGVCRCEVRGEVGVEIATLSTMNRAFLLIGFEGEFGGRPGQAPLTLRAEREQVIRPTGAGVASATLTGVSATARVTGRVSLSVERQWLRGPAIGGATLPLDADPTLRIGAELRIGRRPARR